MLLHTVVTVREQARASLFLFKTWCWRRSPFLMPAELRLQQSRPPLGPVPVPSYNSERHLFCSAMEATSTAAAEEAAAVSSALRRLPFGSAPV